MKRILHWIKGHDWEYIDVINNVFHFRKCRKCNKLQQYWDRKGWVDKKVSTKIK